MSDTSLDRIEQTVALLLKNDITKFNKFENLNLETLNVLEDLIFDTEIIDAEELGNRFKGVVIVKIYPEGDIKITCKNPIQITKEDKEKINNWLKLDTREIYTNGHHRIDLENYIILFKIYTFNKNRLFVGHVVDNSIISRIELLEARQEYLMRNFI